MANWGEDGWLVRAVSDGHMPKGTSGLDGWCLSGCCGSVAEHWRLKPELSCIRLPAFSLSSIFLITSKSIYFQREARYSEQLGSNLFKAKSELHWCYGRPWEVDYLAAEYLSSANITTANQILIKNLYWCMIMITRSSITTNYSSNSDRLCHSKTKSQYKSQPQYIIYYKQAHIHLK